MKRYLTALQTPSRMSLQCKIEDQGGSTEPPRNESAKQSDSETSFGEIARPGDRGGQRSLWPIQRVKENTCKNLVNVLRNAILYHLFFAHHGREVGGVCSWVVLTKWISAHEVKFKLTFVAHDNFHLLPTTLHWGFYIVSDNQRYLLSLFTELSIYHNISIKIKSVKVVCTTCKKKIGMRRCV